MPTSNSESAFDFYWRTLSPGYPAPVAEYVFAPPRRWRIDRAWIDYLVGVEIDGGNWTQGRHTRGAGYERDCEKGNAAIMMGWSILHFTPSMLERDPAACIDVVVRVLGYRI